jgi:hypothetical protein
MARLATLAVAALTGLLLAGCEGSFGQAGLPAAGDGVQTVSDAADALDAHRSSASDNAKAAIAVTDAFGSFVRDISADQRMLSLGASQRGTSAGRPAMRTIRQNIVETNGKRILSASELVMRPGVGVRDYCQSSAGYSVNGIPSLDETFGWESGVFAGGKRAADDRGLTIWSANASGAVVQASIGSLSIARSGARPTCPMNAPAFMLQGGSSENAFSIPITMAFRRGELFNLTVVNAKFANDESLEVRTDENRQPVSVSGVIANRYAQVATFRADALGNGTLTITSTGAQYIIADWIVVGT